MKNTFSLSNVGRQALTSHASGQKHIKVVNVISVFLKPVKKSKALTQKASKNLSHTVISNETQPTIRNYITNSDTKKAEIHWVLKFVTRRFSNNSCLKLNDLFCAMFPDSRIAQSFKLGADKIIYAVNFGIAPYLRSLLVDEIKQLHQLLSILVAVVYTSYIKFLNQVQKPQTGTSRKFYKVHFRYLMILQPGGRTMRL